MAILREPLPNDPMKINLKYSMALKAGKIVKPSDAEKIGQKVPQNLKQPYFFCADFQPGMEFFANNQYNILRAPNACQGKRIFFLQPIYNNSEKNNPDSELSTIDNEAVVVPQESLYFGKRLSTDQAARLALHEVIASL